MENELEELIKKTKKLMKKFPFKRVILLLYFIG